ncbi:MAG: putative DNA binding domain-containing protein [Magnetococcales bacterium]|nr:putative DNA binding domain-containing protein [Magnetococcales bacterium]
MTDEELEALLTDLESDRVERKESLSDSAAGKIRQAVCAMANDLPDHRQPGVIFVGEKDSGGGSGLAITDQLLQNLAAMRSDGTILPFPVLIVSKKVLSGRTLAVVEVHPSDSPPVRVDGRVWIRVGPRRATATAEEERRLNEKRRARDLPHDLHPLRHASLRDLDLNLFRTTCLPAAVAPEVLEENNRSLEQQLASLRFVTPETIPVPTVVGMLVLGMTPTHFIPGAYVQFLRLNGTDLADGLVDEKKILGPLPDAIRRLEEVFTANIHMAIDLHSSPLEIRRPDYPMAALQQLARNAIMHRDYDTSHAPVLVYWFADRIEIHNPGGPFGHVTRENFGQPGITDYRNPNLAEAMKSLGFVQRFGVGIRMARKAMLENGNPEIEFDVRPNHVMSTLRRRP